MEDLAYLGTIVNKIMPELPEVETVKNVLIPIVKGHKILSIDVLRKSTIEGDINEFIVNLQNETFNDVTRIGKYLIFHLTNNKVIISHLRMEGKYYEFDEKDNDSKYARVVFHLDNNHKLCYDDSRCFGILKLSDESSYLKEEMIAKLGPEPFDVKDVKPLMKKVKNVRKPIKSTLLDQTLITGLGNIYVDEVLFASKIHPLTPANKITDKEWSKIIATSIETLNNAIKAGGSTIKSYHPGKDIDGNFQTRLQAYGKVGEKCPRCGATFRFIKVGGRGTTFCPICQKKLGAPINVAITGKIASGKSLATSTFASQSIPTISSDAIVRDLYQKEEIANKIEQMFNIKFENKVVNKDALRSYLLTHPKDKKKLERFVHPLVKKEIINFLSNNKSPIKAVEVPLLFEAKLDPLFDVIIVTDISEKKQNVLITSRDKEKALYLKEINKTNKIDENKNKASYLISNNSSKEEFVNKINQVITELRGLAK